MRNRGKESEPIAIPIPDNSSREEVDALAKHKGFDNMEQMLAKELERQLITYHKEKGVKLWQ